MILQCIIIYHTHLTNLRFKTYFMPELNDSTRSFFEISLAEFSLADSLYSGKLDNLDFPAKAKNVFGITAVEYVSGFWDGKVQDQSYLNELKLRTDDLGVKNIL